MALKGRDGTEYPTWPMWVLSAVVIVDAIDVSILRGVAPLIQDDFGLSDFQLGLLSFAFILVNTLVAIPAGWMADRYNRKKILGWTLLSWSGLSALAAGSWNFFSLFAARSALGFGQAIDDPASSTMLTDYYPAEVRGRIFSVQQMAGFAGSGVGLGLGGVVGATFGWRYAFLIMGIPGSLIAFAIFRLREPRRGEAEGDVHAEKSSTAGLSVSELVRLAWNELRSELKVIFGITTMRYILIGVSVLLFTASGIGAWLTIYHDRYSGMTAKEAAAWTAIVLTIGGASGTLWGGRMADRVFGKMRGGRIVVVVQAIVACLTLFIISFNTPWIPIRMLIQAAGMFFGASAAPGLRAAMMDVTPSESRGVGTSAFALTSALFGTAAAPPIVGFLSDIFDSLLAAFYIVTPPVLIGALILLRARDTIEADAQQLVTAMVMRQEEAGRAVDEALARHAAPSVSVAEAIAGEDGFAPSLDEDVPPAATVAVRKRAPAKKAPVKKAAVAKKPTKKAAVTKMPAKKVPAKKSNGAAKKSGRG